MDHTIYLDEKQCIDWIDFDPFTPQTLELNDLREPLPVFWDYLEQNCVAECCGIQAFSFTKAAIAQATQYVDKAALLVELEALSELVSQSPQPVVVSSRLNQLMAKPVYSQLLHYLIKELS